MKDDGLGRDERILRQALRLDSDEMPPHLDPALIASAARAQGARSDVLPLAIAAVATGWALSQLSGVALAYAVTAIGPAGLGLIIDAVTAAARALAPATAIAAASFPFMAGAAALVVLAIAQRRAQQA